MCVGLLYVVHVSLLYVLLYMLFMCCIPCVISFVEAVGQLNLHNCLQVDFFIGCKRTMTFFGPLFYFWEI